MKNTIKFILAALPLAIAVACSSYDASSVQQEVDSIMEELETLEQKAGELGAELEAISTLVKSEYITRITDDGKGGCSIKCIKDGVATTVEVVTSADVYAEPIIGIGTYEDGKMYWRQSTDWGESWSWVTRNGKMMPVEGETPTIGVDAQGYWTINGVNSGTLATDKTASIISGVEIDNNHNRVIFTLADGTTFNVLYKEALSLTVESPLYNSIEDWNTSVDLPYKVGGTAAASAIVDYFSAYNTTVSIDKASKVIRVALQEGKEEGNAIIIATAADEVVYQPLFFTHGKIITDLESYIKDNELITPMGEPIIKLQGEMTPFTINVSHNIDVEVSISSDASSWLRYNPTKAAPIVSAFNFVADYYENTLDVERQGSIILTNTLYGTSTKFAVIQKPVVLGGGGSGGGGETKGIATKADLLEFAKAVNAGGSTSRWENSDGEICLLQDINLSDESSWTPIGFAQAEGTGTPAPVMSFKGVFNGQGHCISGINVSFDVTSNGRSIGLFGSLEGAIIKNLTVGAEGDCITATGNPTSTIAMAAVAGYAANTTMTNVINNVDVIYDAECPNGLPIGIGGITGYGKSLSYGSKNKADAVVNNGDIMVKYKIANTQNGAKGVQIGGIAGLVNTGTTVMRNCHNTGIVAAPTGRGGGLIGTIEGSTSTSHACTLSSCKNSGLITDDYFGYSYTADSKRMGGLVGGSQAKEVMIESCVNSGNVFSVNGCRCGGMIGHFNSGTITGCTNEGAILSHVTPKADDGTGGDGPGWIAGYCNTVIENCIPGGYVGEYSDFKDNPSGAPAADMTNAIGYKNSQYFDPAKNQ